MQNTLDQPAEAKVPAAILYIANVRSNRSQVVYGQSGHKYPFRYSKAHDKLIREYHTKEEFQREELDLRRNTRNPFHVCTLLGALDPVQSVLDALESLSKATLKVPAHRRKEALERIVERATKELDELAYLKDPAATVPALAALPATQPEPCPAESQLMSMPMDALKAKAAAPGIKPGDRRTMVELISKRQIAAKSLK
jgi:hypothetical protein